MFNEASSLYFDFFYDLRLKTALYIFFEAMLSKLLFFILTAEIMLSILKKVFRKLLENETILKNMFCNKAFWTTQNLCIHFLQDKL